MDTLPLSSCCFKRKMLDNKDQRVIDISEVNSELGLGASLFMMTTKAMAWFFLVLTILNLPAMIFFYHGNDAMNQGLKLSGLH